MAGQIILYIFLLIVGLVLIVKGGDWFVDAASWIAKVSGIPTFIIGATIVSLATTLPEILVSTIGTIQAVNGWADRSAIDLAIGNAVGSVNANVALIMGISLFALPGLFPRKTYMPKAILLLLAVITVGLCCLPHTMPLGFGFIIIAIFVVFLIENILSAKKQDALEEGTDMSVASSRPENKPVKKKYRPKDKKEIWKNVILFIVGAAGIAGGAILLSTYGQKLAEICKVPSAIIGVTIIAVGTSLPELTTTIIAVRKKQSDLSVGNIIGANIIDMTLILPICCFVAGGNLPVNAQTLYLDLPFCLLACSVALVPAMITGKFRKWQGATMLTCYVAYITVLVLIAVNVIPAFHF